MNRVMVDLDGRRRFERVRLLKPIQGRIGAKRVFIVDVSVNGFRVAHQDAIGGIGEQPLLMFDWEGQSIAVRCTITRTDVQRVGTAASAKSLYHSGLEITHTGHGARSTLRDLVHGYVMRALDERKANARGIPPLAVQYHQTATATEFVRHELIGGTWRQTATTRREQPPNGFNVAADHSDEEIDMLRDAYERGDKSARDIIRKMAELSIGSPAGIPIRKYTP